MFKKLLFTILLFTLILPFVSCVKETEEPKDKIEIYEILEYVTISYNYSLENAYLISNETELTANQPPSPYNQISI
ncbi:MAG: hypothetical protein LBV51_01845, partial [Acholeplasmatales bacterium]|nr:hypothetical protein [Acholeplasmatales bacterium]